MKIPEQIKVGNITYTIESDPNLSKDNDKWGLTNHATAKIVFDSSIDERQQDQAVIHELMHAAIGTCGLEYRLGEKQVISEEDLVRALETPIFQIIEQLVERQKEAI